MKLLDLLPFEHFALATNLSVDEVKRRLKENFDADSMALQSYHGHIGIDSFEMRRLTRVKNFSRNRNSFLPQIKGQFINGMGRTEIEVKMKLWPPVIIFMCFWLGGMGAVCVAIAVGLINNAPWLVERGPILIIPFVMFGFGWVLPIVAFKTESIQSKKFLQRLAEAEIIA